MEDALKHPNWSMGRKITIDSSTLVNKGLEVMEARWLFDVALDQIEVVVHPQSVIHSAVEYEDGAVIAQLGTPDMRLPIQYALYYPKRRTLSGKRLDLFELQNLTFERPDLETFRGLGLAMEAMKKVEIYRRHLMQQMKSSSIIFESKDFLSRNYRYHSGIYGTLQIHRSSKCG